MQRNRLIELDALRGLAAVAVVLFHYFYHYNSLYGHEGLYTQWAQIGRYGVQLFFMISGFVIYWTLTNTHRPMDFIVSRISRLYPVYWCAVLLTFICVHLIGPSDRALGVDHALANLMMFHEYLGAAHVDGVYWTLTVELTFYAWIFLFFKFGLLRYTEYLFVLVLIVSIVKAQGVFEFSLLVNLLIMDKHLSYFLAGICFYKIVNKTASAATFGILALTLLSPLLVKSLSAFIITLGLYSVFYAAVSGRLPILKAKPFVFLGGISYSLYLVHQNIGYGIIQQFYGLGFHPIVPIVLSLTLSICLAYLATRYIEKPALAKIRQCTK